MQEEAKKLAAKKALDWIKPGMIVGLGSGSTAEFFIDTLIQACQKGLQIRAVSSSRSSSEKAKKGGIEILEINEVSRIDLTVDGADEIDPQKRMIKGAGGAHVREKILASSSEEMIVIVDETKLVKKLGKKKLPVEVLFYGSSATRSKIEKLGYQTHWRVSESSTIVLSDNGNLILDISFPAPVDNPEEIHKRMIEIPGVVDTGFFFNLAGPVIVGYSDQSIKVL